MPEKHYKSELVGLFGYPVDENPTVITMEAGFRALGLNYRYCTMEVMPENLKTAVAALKALGFKGAHLTIPHKVSLQIRQASVSAFGQAKKRLLN